ncbi:MAG: glycosyltransferase family 1 protein [Bacteroidetes bacterium]|nr:MAG: glycosyltransferase family 1 protein [Bacteroidota bacterium]
MRLHVISFDIPDPPNYGGVIDVFYKLRALKEAGVKLVLHAFTYGRTASENLEQICEEVHYYVRKTPLQSLPIRYPHIVRSRTSDELLENLLKDQDPILFEGLHTTYYLSHPDLAQRFRMVRMHNIEWEYYHQLAQRESRYWHQQYYLRESRLLHTFENTLAFADKILTISPKDTDYYEERFPGRTSYLPPFHAHTTVSSRPGTGKYCLYHANLSVAENNEAALFLIREVFGKLPDIPMIIAGSGPLPELIGEISEYEHILLRHDPGEAEMEDLLRNAQIHVLPTFQATGIKLKLINSLYTGRYVIANPAMVFRTGLEFGCLVARDAPEFRRMVQQYFYLPFGQMEIAQRKAVLRDTYDNTRNAARLMEVLKLS